MFEVTDLGKIYDEGGQSFQALDGVSFKVEKGELASIMGPSGCGKSTLLNILGLMDQPSVGSYTFEGERVDGLSDTQRTLLRRSKLGFVFQSFNLLPRMTALQNICLPMAYAGTPAGKRLEIGHHLLSKVGLGRKGDKTPLELSGGERQRVGIARSLANTPALLLADEPTGNLDSKTAVEIMALFKELHSDGMTILIVTHDRGIADQTGRVFHFKDGRLIQTETPSQSPARRATDT